MANEKPVIRELPDLKTFCAVIPLYDRFPVDDGTRRRVFALITERTTMDCFCVYCGQPSVFITSAQRIGIEDYDFRISDRIFGREFVCSRNYEHTYHFVFRLEDKIVEKIGQSPSVANIAESDLRQYRAVLTDDDYRELSRAVGLISHGVGIGSFVYLRRIFENLINEAYDAAKKQPGWDEGAFQKARMDEKIELLKALLPEFLVEQRKLYAVLSKGVHSLSENECLDAFPIVRMGIELILDQKIAARQQKEKADRAKKEIAALAQKHK